MVFFEVCIQGSGDSRIGNEIERILNWLWGAGAVRRRMFRKREREGWYHWGGLPSCSTYICEQRSRRFLKVGLHRQKKKEIRGRSRRKSETRTEQDVGFVKNVPFDNDKTKFRFALPFAEMDDFIMSMTRFWGVLVISFLLLPFHFFYLPSNPQPRTISSSFIGVPTTTLTGWLHFETSNTPVESFSTS